MNFEENSKLNVVINFQVLFFGIRIDQSIAFQLTKIPKGEDPSVEVPKRGGEERRDYCWFQCHVPGGGLPYETDGDARRKF